MFWELGLGCFGGSGIDVWAYMGGFCALWVFGLRVCMLMRITGFLDCVLMI